MKRYERLKTEYLCYLMNRAQIDAEGARGYSILCDMMMEHTFLPILSMDENRCYECRCLRSDFAEGYEDDTGDILDGLYGEYGTMMELFVVLSEKIAYEMADSEFEAGTGKWFKELLQNCGLIKCCNGWFEEDGKNSAEIADILDVIIYRKFDWDGEGGLFPLRCPKSDQRYAELIIQMNNYIEENYDIC